MKRQLNDEAVTDFVETFLQLERRGLRDVQRRVPNFNSIVNLQYLNTLNWTDQQNIQMNPWV